MAHWLSVGDVSGLLEWNINLWGKHPILFGLTLKRALTDEKGLPEVRLYSKESNIFLVRFPWRLRPREAKRDMKLIGLRPLVQGEFKYIPHAEFTSSTVVNAEKLNYHPLTTRKIIFMDTIGSWPSPSEENHFAAWVWWIGKPIEQ